jgi:hypothetical protein
MTPALAQNMPIDLPARFNAEAEEKGWFFRCDANLNFNRQELTALCALWSEKAVGGRIPSRADFDMRALKPFLRNISFLERHGYEDAARYRFRLFGSSLVELFGERTGQYLDEMVSPTLLRNWTAAYNTLIRYGAPLRFFNHKLSPLVNGEIFAAPLAADAEGRPLVMASAYVALKDSKSSRP